MTVLIKGLLEGEIEPCSALTSPSPSHFALTPFAIYPITFEESSENLATYQIYNRDLPGKLKKESMSPYNTGRDDAELLLKEV